MITSTRLRLTLWFVILVALVGVFFSGLIYLGVSQTFERGFVKAERHLQQMEEQEVKSRPVRKPWKPGPRPVVFQAEYEEAREHLLVMLVLVNGMIWILAGGVGYILAGKLLQPLEEAMEEQKRFVSDASHELRTPVTALKTALEVNIEDKKVHAYERRMMKENLEDVSALQVLIHRLLRLSKTENGNGLDTQVIEVSARIRKVVKRLKPLADEKKITIKFEAEPKQQQVLFDPEAFDELMTILVDNAIKYSEKKGAVKIGSVEREKELEIRVEDEGLGIAEADMEHIFDRFYRVDDARTKTGSDGFGLGLAIAKKIVDQHGARIGVESEEGVGTSFWVRIPKQTR